MVDILGLAALLSVFLLGAVGVFGEFDHLEVFPSTQCGYFKESNLIMCTKALNDSFIENKDMQRQWRNVNQTYEGVA